MAGHLPGLRIVFIDVSNRDANLAAPSGENLKRPRRHRAGRALSVHRREEQGAARAAANKAAPAAAAFHIRISIPPNPVEPGTL